MTRIIAGTAKSLRLTVPSSGVRPTADRVRESLFSALEARGLLKGAVVLDLFAGTGALGLEALSRGARFAYLVDRFSPARNACQRNIEKILPHVAPASAQAIKASAHSFLSQPPFFKVDLVFLDPPYSLSSEALSPLLSLLVPWLAAEAAVILERSHNSPQPALPENIILCDVRRYGNTDLTWLKPV